MKITTPVCIDEDLIKDLKKCNRSNLICSLLREYFEGLDCKNIGKLKEILTKKLKEKAILLKEIREIKKKIKEISEKEKKIFRLSKKHPEFVFKNIDSCDTLIELWTSFRADGKLKGVIEWREYKELFQSLKGGKT